MQVLTHWRVPVSESISIVLGVPSTHGNNGEGEYDSDQEDFTTREPELCLTVPSYREDIEKSIRKISTRETGLSL